jgi:hypothetical protein
MRSYCAVFAAILLTILGVCGQTVADQNESYYDLDPDNVKTKVSQAEYTETKTDSACPCECAEACCCEPVWRLRTNALAMKLSNPNNAVLVTNSFTPGGAQLLNASEFGFRYEGGWEIDLDRKLDDQWDVEARFFRVDGFSANCAGVLSPIGSVVQYVTPLGNTNYPVTTAASYGSQLTNVELNAHRTINDYWSFVAGFRYLSLYESGMTLMRDIGPGLEQSNHSIRATNDLYGFQLGADANFIRRNRLSVDGLLRAGVFGNGATSSVDITHAQSSLHYACNAFGTHTAFVGELGLMANYKFNQHVSLRGGYQMLWLEGVAQASDQVAVSDPYHSWAEMSFKSSPFYDGFVLGLEFVR